jgi:hypothetical protein
MQKLALFALVALAAHPMPAHDRAKFALQMGRQHFSAGSERSVAQICGALVKNVFRGAYRAAVALLHDIAFEFVQHGVKLKSIVFLHTSGKYTV